MKICQFQMAFKRNPQFSEKILLEQVRSEFKRRARMLEKGVRRSINAEHADLLEPIIRKSISDALGRDRNRMANLLIRSTAQVSQIRYLLINLLGRAGSPRKVTAEQLNKILDWSRKQAREDIIRRSPATEELIKAVSAWMDGDGGSEEETAT